MKYIYEEITNESPTGISKIIKRTDENNFVAWIPMVESNSDYQRYLEYLADNPDETLAE